jgi:hypothetical protein
MTCNFCAGADDLERVAMVRWMLLKGRRASATQTTISVQACPKHLKQIRAGKIVKSPDGFYAFGEDSNEARERYEATAREDAKKRAATRRPVR